MAGEKFRILVVDDISETRENVRKLLQFESDLEVVGMARTGREAIQLCQELNPDVVLMDINMPDMDGIAATEAIREKMPAIKIVILSVQSDPNYMRRAMLAGARDFLTKPPMADELIPAVRRAGQLAREEKTKAPTASFSVPAASNSFQRPSAPVSFVQGRVIMVYSPKGGTGVTTLAVNLALTLHNEDTRVALIDGNLQFGDVAVFLNEQGKNTVLDLALRSNELEPDIVNEVMIKHAASGMSVLAAPSRPADAERVSGEQFSKMLQYLRQMYAYVIVDTASYLNDITLSTLDESDLIVLVVTQEIPAIKNARIFLDLLSSLGIQRENVCFVMNRYDKRIAITSEKIAENLKQELSGVIPLDEKIVIPSVNRGVPFVLDNKTQPSARAVFALAESLRGLLSKLDGGAVAKQGRK